MKTAIVLLVAALTLVTFVPTPAAAEPGPCPSKCEPPVPCGWAPDIRKDPVGWAEWAAGCLARYDPVLP